MKRLYIMLLCLISIGLLAAKPNPLQRPLRKAERLSGNLQSYPTRADSATGFDVQKYTIDISISQDPAFISGNVLAEVLAEEDLSSITYHLVGLEVSSVLVNGQAVAHSHQDGEIQIPLNVSAGESFETQVFYSGTPQLSGDFYNVGMYIRPGVIFTISDPDAGRYWWPCYDHPWDKAIVDIIVTMRSDWKVAANGLRESIVDNGDGTATTTWRGYHPMTTYLVCITASDYQEIHQNAMQGGLPIINFVTQSQYQNALNDLATLPDMIDYYSELFGDYPFEKYGNATVSMTTFGAMEHQTMTTLGNYIIDGMGTHELTIAHELVHQWYGNAVSFLTFADVWLSEGFATYGEHLWVDKTQGWHAATEYVRDSYHQYYLSWENTTSPPTIYDPPFNNYFYPQSYEKAASVLHMLRLKMGDYLFFELLGQWFTTYKDGNAITREFIDMAQDISGMDLEQFFQQWIYGTGIPSAEYGLWYHPDLHSLKIDASSNSPTATSFDLDIPILITHSAGQDSLLFRATAEGNENLFGLPSEPMEHSANHGNWTFLRELRENKPVLHKALASSSSVYLRWEAFPLAEAYLVQRRSPGDDDWQNLTPTAISQTEFIDSEVENDLSHEYRIKAVDSQGFVSTASEILEAMPVTFSYNKELLVVDETRDGTGASISPDDAMVDDFYAAALLALDYDQWDIAVDGMPDLVTLGEYKVVLWHDDDFASNEIHAAEDLLLGYLLGEGNLLISGWKTASIISSSFWDVLGTDLEVFYDNAPVLMGASSEFYPNLTVDTQKLAPTWNEMLPYISSFQGFPHELYLAEAAVGSEAEFRSVVVKIANLIMMGFPLYFVEMNGARGFLQQVLPELGVVSTQDEVVPAYQLRLDSYPNPFNPNTTVSFELPCESQMSLKLYNLKGQMLRELVRGIYPAGLHRITLEASDLPSGIYFIRLNHAGEQISRKISLVK